jgi:hypothetical protein
MKFEENKSIGHKTGDFFIGGKMVTVPIPQWENTSQGDAIRSKRRANGITLRKAASMIGITGTELTGLEIGKYTISEDDFDDIMRKLSE